MVDQTSTPHSRSKSYSEKLLDPRWQIMRLEVLRRDDFSCVNCGEKTKTLHVHHKSYNYGANPWDCPEDNLETLCIDCHKQVTEEQKAFKRFAQIVGKHLTPDDCAQRLEAAIERFGFDNTSPYEFLLFTECMIKDRKFAELCWSLMVGYATNQPETETADP